MKLSDFRKSDGQSQWGEDGIIEKIFSLIGTESKRVVDFGAADGRFMSNSFKLWHDLGWRAVLAEANDELFERLEAEVQNFHKVRCFHQLVTSIDDLIDDDPCDFLSVDVDGLEYHLLYSMKSRPRVICVEHNPTFPPHLKFVGYDGQGSSALALCDLLEARGYAFVTATLTNLFFVLEEEFGAFSRFDCSLVSNFDYSSLNYVVTDYSGNYDVKGVFPYGFSRHTQFDVEGIFPDHIAKYVLSDLNTQKMIWNRFSDFPAEKNAVNVFGVRREEDLPPPGQALVEQHEEVG